MANYTDIRRAKGKLARYKRVILDLYPTITEESGIYFLTRIDENGIKYAYVGQAKHILNRLAEHMNDYKQHIDLSLKKHGLFSSANENGWKIGWLHFPLSQLDEMEKHYIKQYADKGYQLRNKNTGGQGEGKSQINEYRQPKGYRDGLAQGRKNLAKELRSIIDKHLVITLKPEKANNKVSIRQFEKFYELLGEGDGE